MKNLYLILLIAVLMPVFVFPQQKEIVEEVTVEWWVVPIFTLDKSGQAVLDLHESDFELKVDNQKIEGFTLVKKSYTVSPQPAESETPAAKTPPVPVPRKNIFLIFDTALSTKSCTAAAKAMAYKIINEAEKDSRFFVLTIEPFAGLAYVGGLTGDKAQLLKIIDQKVKGKSNSRIPDPQEVVAEMAGRGGSKYGPEDAPFIEASISKYYKRKSKSFVQAFESLYYALNAIKDNKFIYLFTEGISTAVQESDKGDRSMYRKYLEDIAANLGRSGSVLFIINPASGVEADLSQASGKDSLRFLAQSSGGKYLEGKGENILREIDNMHQAYYEIFFPAVPKSKSNALKISIEPKRQGLEIHTLLILEKTRDYAQMQPMEKEILALNLISGNPLYKTGFSCEKASIDDISQKKNTVTYRVVVAERFLNRTLDLYKIWKSPKETKETGPANIRVEKETWRTGKPKAEITFKNVNPGEETYFAIMDGEQKIALVQGIKGAEEESPVFSLPQEAEDWTTREEMVQEKQAETPTDTATLNQLLAGVADYCERLKKVAFHYICKEKIYENQKPLRGDQSQQDIGTVDDPMFNTPTTGYERREENIYDKVISHSFNYRLIKMGEKVKEERDIIIPEPTTQEDSKPKEPPKTTAESLKQLRFASSKAVFGPITLLAADRQVKYNFRLVEYEEMQGRRTAVIEALPKDEKDSQFIYGKVWIDTQDFSVLKIKANPNSILGYERLRKFADSISTRLLLTLETDFFKLREGIRFPTRIHFAEFYKGGPFVSRSAGSKGWTRTETLTTYDDYLFFDISTDVKYQ